MAATLATVSAILKEIYEPKIRDQLEDTKVALKRIKSSSEGVSSQVGGRYVVFPLRVRRNAGLGARNEMEALPVPGQQGYTNARVGLKYLYGGVQLSGQAIELANENYQAFASVLQEEMTGLKDDLGKDQNRQVYGDGSGAVAVIKTVGTGVNTLTTLDPMYLQLGMMIDLVDGTSLGSATPTVKLSNRQITAIDTTTGVLTFDGAVGNSAVGDIIVRTGSVNREWTGFTKIFKNTGVLYNVDAATEPTWRAVVDTNGTPRALSEGLLIKMADDIRANGGKTTAMFSNLGVRRAYFNLLVQQRRYSNTKDFGGGFTGLTFTTDNGEIPFVADIDCPKKKVFFANEKELTLYQDQDWSWMNRDGSNWQRVIGYDAYEARMFQYSEIGCHRRNSQGVLDNIIEA